MALEAESAAWYELAGLVRQLTLDERMTPGYYEDPAWSVRDLVGHVGAWLAEAALQLERIAGGTYEGHDVDIDGLNAALLEDMRDQPVGGRLADRERRADADAPVLGRARPGERGSGLVDREVGFGALRRSISGGSARGWANWSNGGWSRAARAAGDRRPPLVTRRRPVGRRSWSDRATGSPTATGVRAIRTIGSMTSDIDGPPTGTSS